jgi:4-amino-4-deoxy-L-arabinose transferase-like glycosyltransferase
MSPDVADQDHLTAYRPPGPSLIWAGLYVLFGHRFDVVRVANCLVGAVAVFLTYAIGRRCFSERIGLLAAALYAVFPTALLYTVDLLSEALGTLWFLAFLLVCLQFAERPGWGRALAAGLLLGIELLTRANCIVMLPLYVIWAVWQFRGQWRVLLQAAAVPALAVALLVPWAVRNYMVFHEFIPLSTMGGSVLLQGNNDIVVSDPAYFGYNVWDTNIPEYREALQSAGDEIERDKRARTFAVQWIKDHPEKWWFMVRHKLWRGLTPVLQPNSPRLYRAGMLVAWGPVLVLFGLAYFPTLIAALRRNDPGWLIHLAILHVLLLSIIFFGLARYRQPIEPLCIILAVTAVAFLFDRIQGARRSGQPPAIARAG